MLGVVCTGLVCPGLSPLASIYSGLGESKWGRREGWREERERARRREEREDVREGGSPGCPKQQAPGSLGSPGRQNMAAPGTRGLLLRAARGPPLSHIFSLLSPPCSFSLLSPSPFRLSPGHYK